MDKTIISKKKFNFFFRKNSIEEITVCHFKIINTHKFKCVKVFDVTISCTIIKHIIYLIFVWSIKLIFFNNNAVFFFVFMRSRIVRSWSTFNSKFLSHILQHPIKAIVYQEDIQWKKYRRLKCSREFAGFIKFYKQYIWISLNTNTLMNIQVFFMHLFFLITINFKLSFI